MMTASSGEVIMVTTLFTSQRHVPANGCVATAKKQEHTSCKVATPQEGSDCGQNLGVLPQLLEEVVVGFARLLMGPDDPGLVRNNIFFIVKYK